MRDRIKNNAKLGRHCQRHRRFLAGPQFHDVERDLVHGALQVVRKLNSGAPEDLAHVLGQGKRVGIVRRDPPDLLMDGEGDLDEFVERRRVVRRAERARVFGAVERFQRGTGFKNAAAAGTEHVPGHVEEA